VKSSVSMPESCDGGRCTGTSGDILASLARALGPLLRLRRLSGKLHLRTRSFSIRRLSGGLWSASDVARARRNGTYSGGRSEPWLIACCISEINVIFKKVTLLSLQSYTLLSLLNVCVYT